MLGRTGVRPPQKELQRSHLTKPQIVHDRGGRRSKGGEDGDGAAELAGIQQALHDEVPVRALATMCGHRCGAAQSDGSCLIRAREKSCRNVLSGSQVCRNVKTRPQLIAGLPVSLEDRKSVV